MYAYKKHNNKKHFVHTYGKLRDFLYENSNNNYSYHIPENKIFVIHKNCHFNMYTKRTGSGVLCKKLILSNECASDIRKVYVSTLGYPKFYDNESFPQLNKHVISIMRSKKVDIEVFKELCNEDIYDNKDTHMLIYFQLSNHIMILSPLYYLMEI